MSPEKSIMFDFLSTPNESLRIMTPADVDVPTMRVLLTEAGFNLAISEAERQSLTEAKFRSLESGRGTGMVAALGRQKAEELLVWCKDRSAGGPRLKKAGEVTEDSEGRGLRQLSADLIQLVTNPEQNRADLDRFCLRTNQRVMKGLLWASKGNDANKARIRQAFFEVPEPESTFSSVPSGSVEELWEFLVR